MIGLLIVGAIATTTGYSRNVPEPTATLRLALAEKRNHRGVSWLGFDPSGKLLGVRYPVNEDRDWIEIYDWKMGKIVSSWQVPRTPLLRIDKGDLAAFSSDGSTVVYASNHTIRMRWLGSNWLALEDEFLSVPKDTAIESLIVESRLRIRYVARRQTDFEFQLGSIARTNRDAPWKHSNIRRIWSGEEIDAVYSSDSSLFIANFSRNSELSILSSERVKPAIHLPEQPSLLSLSSSTEMLAIGFRSGRIAIVNSQSGQCQMRTTIATSSIVASAWSQDENLLVLGVAGRGQKFSVIVLQPKLRKMVVRLPSGPFGCERVAVTSDNAFVAAVGSDDLIKVWKLKR